MLAHYNHQQTLVCGGKMSSDFMVFDPASAPRSPRAFRVW